MEPGISPVQVAPVPAYATEHRVRFDDFEHTEDYLRAYLDDKRFRSTYPRAHKEWSDAWAMLWRANSRDKLITVGRAAHKAISEFAAAVAESNERLGANPDSREAMDRLSAAVESYRPQIGDNRCAVHQEMLGYWRLLDDALQPHEHRARQEGERLRWEHGRRVVVFTALLMVEVDRCLVCVSG